MKNVAIYVDYENVYKRVKEYGYHVVEDLDLFVNISEKFKSAGFNIVKYVAFANFEDRDFSVLDQTRIHNFGVDVRHCSLDGKSSTDMELVVEVMTDLYNISNIDVFVIISNDRDYIPLVSAIKSKSKTTYTISTKVGFNDMVNVFSDYHQYLEDLLLIEPEVVINDVGIPINRITEEMRNKAKEVCQMLYNSNYWKKFIDEGEPVSLRGYSTVINKNIWKKETVSRIERYFHAAHTLEFVQLYKEGDKLFFKEGSKMTEVVKRDEETLAT